MNNISDEILAYIDSHASLRGDVVYQIRDHLATLGCEVSLDDVVETLYRLEAYGEIKMQDRNRRNGDKYLEIDLVLSIDS